MQDNNRIKFKGLLLCYCLHQGNKGEGDKKPRKKKQKQTNWKMRCSQDFGGGGVMAGTMEWRGVFEMAPIQRSEGLIGGSINVENVMKERQLGAQAEEHRAGREKRRFQL